MLPPSSRLRPRRNPESRLQFQQAVEKKRSIVVGVNDFIALTEGNHARTIPTLRIDAEIERSQIAR